MIDSTKVKGARIKNKNIKRYSRISADYTVNVWEDINILKWSNFF